MICEVERRADVVGIFPNGAANVIGLLSSGMIRMLDVRGRALYRGNAVIESMYFARDIDPENW